MRAPVQFPALRAATFGPLRGWLRPAKPAAPTLVVDQQAPEDLLLEAAASSAADPDILLARPTLTGLNEQALLHALNFRDLAGLQEFEGFGPKVAAKLIEFREREKFFTSLDELVRVPLIGPTRFQRLVGRESFFFTHPLHSALRLPPSRSIRLSELRPLAWPAPGLPRLFLGASADRANEQALAARSRWHLHERRIGSFALYLHTLAAQPESRADFLLRSLPRLLRPRLASGQADPADPITVPVPTTATS
jgi:hypothetical protein